MIQTRISFFVTYIRLANVCRIRYRSGGRKQTIKPETRAKFAFLQTSEEERTRALCSGPGLNFWTKRKTIEITHTARTFMLAGRKPKAGGDVNSERFVRCRRRKVSITWQLQFEFFVYSERTNAHSIASRGADNRAHANTYVEIRIYDNRGRWSIGQCPH